MVECNESGDFRIGLNEADWFKNNEWRKYMYYTFSSVGDLEADSQTGLDALLVGTGAELSFQSRASNLAAGNVYITDYLDTTVNTDADNVFESVLRKVDTMYNDQIFIVSP